MGCSICGRGNCCRSFHSLEQQAEHDEAFGKYEDKIYDLKEENTRLEKENDILWNFLNSEQVEDAEKQIEGAE